MTTPREAFRRAVFERDRGRCVVCGAPGQDAHHIMERRLFDDGGYDSDNGACLCGPCHLEAERTTLGCEAVRAAAGITRVVLPPHLYSDQPYDKWGNPILPNGQRLRGELFLDESVQKVLAAGGLLPLFTNRVRHPRTYHLPWSRGATDDDRVLRDTGCFEGEEVVVTVKMDGEQTTMYADGIHARSLDYARHPSRSWVANLHAGIGWRIPAGWRVCGENLYAKHSIHYRHLPAYFLVFTVWNERNECLSWDDTAEWSARLGLRTVPLLYRGPWDERRVRALQSPTWNGDEMEGYVVRLAGAFPYGRFRRSVGKYVREGHARTQPHWLHGQPMVRNEVEGDRARTDGAGG